MCAPLRIFGQFFRISFFLTFIIYKVNFQPFNPPSMLFIEGTLWMDLDVCKCLMGLVGKTYQTKMDAHICMRKGLKRHSLRCLFIVFVCVDYRYSLSFSFRLCVFSHFLKIGMDCFCKRKSTTTTLNQQRKWQKKIIRKFSGFWSSLS